MGPDQFMETAPGELVPTEAWEEYTERGMPQRRLAKGLAFVPAPMPPSWDLGGLLAQIYTDLLEAQSALGQLDGSRGDLPIAKLLTAPLMHREAILSSRIENTIASATEVAIYEATRESARNDPVEVSNYRRALWHGVRSELPLSMRLVREMHRMLLENVRGHRDRPGEIRNEQNWIGRDPSSFESARFVPPPPGHVLEAGLRNLETFWNLTSPGMPTLLAVAIAHYQFEAIHPFRDGNGRIGRVLIMLSLLRYGLLSEPLLYVSGYFERHDREYRDLLLRVSTHGDWLAWCRFFLRAVATQARESIDRIALIRGERVRVLDALAAENAPAAIMRLVDRLIETPAITAAETESFLSVTNPTARNYLSRLEKLGFVHELTGQSYGRVWGASRILSLIDAAAESAA